MGLSDALPRSIETAVVGGGLLGLCVAGFLAEAQREVAIIDAGRPDGTTTNAGSLHVQMQSRFLRLYPDQVPALEAALHLYPKAVAFWAELQRHLHANFGLKVGGGLMVAESRQQLDFLVRKCQRERAVGIDAAIVERPGIERMAPYLGPAVVGVEMCANEGRLDPLETNRALRHWVDGLGVPYVGRTPVERIVRDGRRFNIETQTGTVGAASVVIAAAAGSRGLAEGLGIRLPVEAEPLHMNVTEPTTPFIAHLVQHADRMVTIKQLASGHVLIGGGWAAEWSVDRSNPAVRLASLVGNTTLAQHIVPAIGRLRIIRTWGGVNTTADGIGVLGPIHGVPGAFVAIPGDAGYTLGPLSARLVADAVLGRQPREDLAPFSPSRFQ